MTCALILSFYGGYDLVFFSFSFLFFFLFFFISFNFYIHNQHAGTLKTFDRINFNYNIHFHILFQRGQPVGFFAIGEAISSQQ